MHACFILLTLAVSLSAPQEQLKTVNQGFFDFVELVGQQLERVSQHAGDNGETQVQILEFLAQAEERDKLTEIELKAQLSATQNLTSQLLTDLQVLKGRQAIAGAVQVAQVCMFLAYILFCLGIYLVKHCKKQQEEVAKADFALLEQQLAESRRRRRAAAAVKNKPTPQ